MIYNRPIYKEEIIQGKRWIIVTLKDNGIGWSWDDMPKHVRDKYLKTKSNIESLGGKFFYENTPYKGAKVTIKIPSCIPEKNGNNILAAILSKIFITHK